MKNIVKIIILSVLIGFFACTNAAKTNTSNVSTRNTAADSTGNWIIADHGNVCSVKEAYHVIIKTAGEFDSEWNKAFNGLDFKPRKPEIDFSKSWAIAAYLGEKMKGGFTIDIQSIGLEDKSLKINIKHISPGPNCISSMSIEYPYMFVIFNQIPSEKTVFEVVEETKDCN